MEFFEIEHQVSKQLAETIRFRHSIGWYCLPIHTTSGEMVTLYKILCAVYSPDVEGEAMDEHIKHFNSLQCASRVFRDAIGKVAGTMGIGLFSGDGDIDEAMHELETNF